MFAFLDMKLCAIHNSVYIPLLNLGYSTGCIPWTAVARFPFRVAAWKLDLLSQGIRGFFLWRGGT